MLLAYDKTGAVVFQVGTNSLFPDGPPDKALPAMFAEVGVSPVAWVRLHDEEDAELVRDVLRYGAKVVHGQVVLGDIADDAETAPSTPVDPSLVTAWQDATTLAQLRAAGAALFAALGVTT